jgi:hypothetical protein
MDIALGSSFPGTTDPGARARAEVAVNEHDPFLSLAQAMQMVYIAVCLKRVGFSGKLKLGR